MILITTDCFHINGISLLNRFGCFYNYLRNFIIQKTTPLFYRKYNMIVYLPNAVITSAYSALFLT